MYKNTYNLVRVNARFKFLFLFTLLTMVASYSQVNLLSNGNIEGTGGFAVWNYNKVTPNGSSNSGDYAVVTNAQQFNSSYVSTTDHSGSGNMLIFDSQLKGGQQHFWGVGTNGSGVCALSTAVTHTFSYWIRSVSAGEKAEVDVLFNNASNVQLISGNKIAPDVSAGWQQVVYTFTPTNNCVNITFRHTNTNDLPDGFGRDFAIDDITLTAPPAPLAIQTFSNPASCPNNSDASIEASQFGGVAPYTFTLSGGANQTNNTGVFIGLAPGNYTVQVRDGNNDTATTAPITLSSPVDITTSNDAIICRGESTNLTVNGSTSYTWVANPADASIVDPTLSSQTVSPTQTTTYKVSSVISSDALGITNLVVNGDFGAGNTGFLTDYNFKDPNTAKEQKAYGVVSNPKAWEEDFTACPDRSTTNDLMLVVDGSIDANNNQRIWSQVIPVEPGKDYIFSYWLQNVVSITPPTIETQINGVVVGSALAPAQACGWVRHFYKWNAGTSNTATISLIDRNTALAGNDFAIDDIAFALAVQCTIEKEVKVTVNQPVTATFTFPTTIDQGDVAPDLPPSSSNGLKGIWDPKTIDSSVLGTKTYTFTPEAGQCGSGSVDVTVLVRDPSKVDPTFTLPATICLGDVAPGLSSPSENGIVGVWTPAVVDNTKSDTYLFTPNDVVLNNTFQYDLVVTQKEDPAFTFDFTATYDFGDATVTALPSTTNNITGVWEIEKPAGVFTSVTEINKSAAGTFNYRFTPTAGQCANVANRSVTINKVTPSFTFGQVCAGSDGLTYLQGLTPTPNVAGVWSAGVQQGDFIFTPADQVNYNNLNHTLVFTQNADPTFTFDFTTTYDLGDVAVTALPSTTNNITGAWEIENPAGVFTAVTEINKSVAGTFNYRFTPTAGQCANVANRSVTINKVTPSFTFGQVCAGSDGLTYLQGLTPTPNVAGVWSVGVQQGEFVFTPTDQVNYNNLNHTLVFTPNADPAFTFDFTTTYNFGDTTVTALPSTTNNITGAWEIEKPAGVFTSVTEINKSAAGVFNYRFVANNGGCNNSFSRSITINKVTPSFTVPAICTGGDRLALLQGLTPTPNIAGVWTVGVNVDEFVFTPNDLSNYNVLTQVLSFTPITDLGFTNVTICSNDPVPSFPVTTIKGAWSPSSIDMTKVGQTVTYTYSVPPVATSGICVTGNSFDVTINPTPGQIKITGECEDSNFILRSAPVNNSYDPATVSYIWTNSSNTTVGGNQSWLDVTALNSTTFPEVYTVRVTNANGCSNTETFNVLSDYCRIPKGISPNGDGENETFNLTALNPKKIQIFNRYGVEVYSKTNYTNQWDGKSNDGNELPASTYYYVVELRTGETKVGWVYIAR